MPVELAAVTALRPRHARLAAALGVPADARGGVDLGALKLALTQHGVNSRGWRICLDFGDALLDTVGRPWFRRMHTDGAQAAALLRVLAACEMDVPPPRALLASLNLWRLPGRRIDALSPHFLRAAWKATLLASYEGGEEAQAAFVAREVVPVAVWLHMEMRGSLPEAKLKAGWPALLDAAAGSARAQLAKIEEWPPFVPRVECDGFAFSALCSATALAIEGKTMAHCIGSYAGRCRRRLLRAFAVTHIRTSARVATLTVVEESPGRWAIDQIKGRANGEVTRRVAEAACAVVRSFEDAWTASAAMRQAMDAARRAGRALPEEDDDDDELVF